MAQETIVVPRAEFDMEEPWTTPAVCSPVRLRRSTDSSAPRLSTSVALYYDDDYLNVLFCAADDFVQATYLEHDAPLYEEDVFEMFVAPASDGQYFEIEISPRGTVFDARIESPDGIRTTMRVDRGWTCDGLVTAVRNVTESDGVRTLDVIVRVPFYALERSTPGDGEEWRANFFRIDRNPLYADEFSAWQPTFRTPPDFHLTAAFGALRFAE